MEQVIGMDVNGPFSFERPGYSDIESLSISNPVFEADPCGLPQYYPQAKTTILSFQCERKKEYPE
jgi:hypothetical protein